MKLRLPIFALILLIFPSLAIAQVELAVPEVRGASGGLTVVPVAISEGKSIAALQLTVTFDASLLSVAADDAVIPGSAVADHSIGVSRDSGKIKVVIFSSSLANLKAGPGSLVNIAFQVARGAVPGASSTLTLTDAQASDSSGAAVAVTVKAGRLTVATDAGLPTAGANDLVFPQIVNGSFAGGSYVTTLFFVSRAGVATSGEARFFNSDGTPLTARLTDGRSGAAFPFTISEGGSAFLQTDGSGGLAVGYARVIASGPIGGTILFSQLDTARTTLAETGVGAAVAATHFTVPILYSTGSANTGIAFANPSAQALDIVLTLRNQSGAAMASKTTSLPPGQHAPRFATDYFSEIAVSSEFQGSIEGTASAPVSAVALKQQGLLLTTFPVVEVQ